MTSQQPAKLQGAKTSKAYNVLWMIKRLKAPFASIAKGAFSLAGKAAARLDGKEDLVLSLEN